MTDFAVNHGVCVLGASGLSLCREFSIPYVSFCFIWIGRLKRRNFGSHLSVKASNKGDLAAAESKLKCLLGTPFKKEGGRKQGSFVGSTSSRHRVCVDTCPFCLLHRTGSPQG